jgi:hypothetical protein
MRGYQIFERRALWGALSALALAACSSSVQRHGDTPSVAQDDKGAFVAGRITVFRGVPHTGAILETSDHCYVLAASPDLLANHRDLLSAPARVWGEVSILAKGPDEVIAVLVKDRWVIPSLCGRDELLLYVEKIELV